MLGEVQERNASQQQIDNALAYRDEIARTGRFLTFSSGAATIGSRMRPDPQDRAALRIVRETDSGLVIRGKIGMHTSPAYAEDVYIGATVRRRFPGPSRHLRRAGERARRHRDLPPHLGASRQSVPGAALQPVRRTRRPDVAGRRAHPVGTRVPDRAVPPERIARWLFWHQLYCWLSKAEFTLGLALACTHAMGLTAARPDDQIPARSDHRRADRAKLPDRGRTRSAVHRGGLLLSEPLPSRGRQHRDAEGAAAHERNAAHPARLVAGGGARRHAILPSRSSRAGLEESFSGGGYTALQRSALLQMAWDHVSSALDGARVGVRAACQWRHPGLARPAAAQLRAITTNSPTACCASSAWRCRRST